MLSRALVLAAACSLAGCVSASNGDYKAPVAGTLVEGYGQQAAGFHHGIDIAASGGARVAAAMDGRVIRKGRSKSAGRYVVIDHGAGLRTTYAGLSRVTVWKGDFVDRGQTIGRVGRRGGEPAELHFELRLANQSIDPMPVIGGKARGSGDAPGLAPMTTAAVAGDAPGR